MENKNQNKEPMNQMMIGMNQMPLNGMSNYQYYLSDYHPMQNYPPIHFYGNNQQMNGFPYHLQPPREEPTYPPNPGVKAQISSKSSSPNVQVSEKPKMKSYINLLITSVNNLLKEGKITTKYLNEKTEHKATHQNINSLYSLNNININNISTINRNISETSSSNTGKKSSANKQTINGTNNNYINDINHKNYDICENHFCENVFTPNKDKNRIKIKGLKHQEKTLCKMCYEAVKNGQFCYYCNAIYRDGLVDNTRWVECDYCKGWEHIVCEIKKGKKYSEEQELLDEKHYMCPVCVNKTEEQNNINNKLQKKLINKKRKGDMIDDQKNKKNQRKDLRNLKSEKCSELIEDIKKKKKYINCK